MFYKPKYCCNCGEKVERVDWNILTSRRFCEACAVEKRRYDNLPRGLIVLGALGTMFGFGSMFSRSGQDAQPIRSNLTAPAALRQETSAGAASAQSPTADPRPQANQQAAVVETQLSESTGSQTSKQTNGTQHFCGALTKKGTPCSRKVKAAGTRCFQHEGKSLAPLQNQ